MMINCNAEDGFENMYVDIDQADVLLTCEQFAFQELLSSFGAPTKIKAVVMPD
jgi:hypothetical protein